MHPCQYQLLIVQYNYWADIKDMYPRKVTLTNNNKHLLQQQLIALFIVHSVIFIL